MSEAKKVAIGVVTGVLGIAVLFALILMIVGKGDEPAPRPQLIVAQQPKPVPPKPAPVQVQPQALLAEQPLTEPRAVSSAGHTTQDPGKASTSTSDAQAPAESTPPLVQAKSLLGSATPTEKLPASSTRAEPNARRTTRAALRGEPSPFRRHFLRHHGHRHPRLRGSEGGEFTTTAHPVGKSTRGEENEARHAAGSCAGVRTGV